MGITIAPSSSGRHQSRAVVVKCAWTTEAPAHAVSDYVELSGLLCGLVTVPGTPAPSDGYGVALLDGSVDMLRGVGASRDSDATEWAEVCVSDTHPVPVDGRYVLKVSAADSDTAGAAWLMLAT